MSKNATLANLITDSLDEGNRNFKTGKKITRRVVLDIARPKGMSAAQIQRLRKRLHLSQGVFADVLNVSVKTVQAWEADINSPNQAALRLLDILKKQPEIMLKAIAQK